MYRLSHSVFASFCFLLTAQCLFSQIVLQGTVTDNGGEYLGGGTEPVENALVTVTDQTDSGRIFSSHTDNLGHYRIEITQTAVSQRSFQNPGDFRMFQNYPNPFNPSTVIGFYLARPSHIRIEIYSVLGRKIKTLVDGFKSEGSGQMIWNATDDQNQVVPAGVYIYSLQAEDIRINRKMLLIDGGHGISGSEIIEQTEMVVDSKTVMNKLLSNWYILRVTGTDIETYEKQDLEVNDITTYDVTVYRTAMDIDGNIYKTVKIGTQWWMQENLKVKHYRNGDSIMNVTDNTQWLNPGVGYYCNYENDEEKGSIYGRLYNVFVLKDGRNVAPAGWHVPSDLEWQSLVDFLGGDSLASGKMKQPDTTMWASPNTGATNESGFTALPAGYRGCSGSFSGMFYEAYYWSSTFVGLEIADFRTLYFNSTKVEKQSYGTLDGYSIRCLRD